MNDAGTVIVADVYAAGEAPIEGMDKDALVEGLRARGHRSVVPLPGPESLAEMVHAIAKPGDYVVCLGAGNITAWAHALPAQLAELQGSAPGARVRPLRRAAGKRRMSARRRPWRTRCPPSAAACRPARRSRPSPGSASAAPAEWLARPADAEDLRRAAAPAGRRASRCTVIGAASNLIVRDGGVPGLVVKLGGAFGGVRSEADGVVAGAAALDVDGGRARRRAPGSPGWSSCAASRAASAAPWR